MFIGLIIADLLMIAIFIWKFSALPPQIPLFYSEIWGENQLVDTWMIVVVPALLHIFFFLNRFVYARYFWQNHTIKHIVHVINWAWIVFLTSIFLRIIFLIT